MEIKYTSHNFPPHLGSLLQGVNQIDFSTPELLWSAITVGRESFVDVIQHGIYSIYEILYRASIVFANLTLNGNEVIKSSAYEHLDPSEKSAVSYFLGLTFSKLLSNRLLNVPWLLHIDMYRAQFERNGQAFGFGSSRIRPDLIGKDNMSRWVVMEAKGRTNSMESGLLTRAKNQTRNLRLIGTDFPNMRVALVAHFNNGRLVVDWEDPEDVSNEHFDLEINNEEFLNKYYKLIFNILSSSASISFGEYIIYTLNDINVTLGLEKEFFEAYKTQSLNEVKPKNVFPTDQFAKHFNNEFFSGKDGIVVGLGENWYDIIKSNKKFNG